MIYRAIVFSSVFAASAAVLLLAQAPTAGQQAATAPAKAATTKTAEGKTWKQPLTPDGAPDISGIYDSETATPLERPRALGSKEFYTDEEFKAVAEKLRKRDPSAPGLSTRGNGGGADGGGEGGGRAANRVNVQYEHDIFGYDITKSNYVATRRTSLIVGPEGVVPPMTAEGRQRNAARAAATRGHEYDSIQSMNLETRCILSARQQVPLLPIEDSNTHFQIVQGKGWVAIYQELNHDVRVIPTDGRTHLSKEIRQLQGDSVGHWEGNTLVVDTTNFTDRTPFRGSSENLHLVERYTKVSDDMLLYRFTLDDPHTWERPWTVEVPWMVAKGQTRLFEYACTEGNESVGILLQGARTKEAEEAARTAK